MIRDQMDRLTVRLDLIQSIVLDVSSTMQERRISVAADFTSTTCRASKSTYIDYKISSLFEYTFGRKNAAEDDLKTGDATVEDLVEAGPDDIFEDTILPMVTLEKKDIDMDGDDCGRSAANLDDPSALLEVWKQALNRDINAVMCPAWARLIESIELELNDAVQDADRLERGQRGGTGNSLRGRRITAIDPITHAKAGERPISGESFP